MRGEDYFLWTISQIKRKFTFALDPRHRRRHSHTRGHWVHDFGELGLDSTEPLPSRLPQGRGTIPVGVPWLVCGVLWVCYYTHLTKWLASNFKNTSLTPTLSNKQINWAQGDTEGLLHHGRGLLQQKRLLLCRKHSGPNIYSVLEQG